MVEIQSWRTDLLTRNEKQAALILRKESEASEGNSDSSSTVSTVERLAKKRKMDCIEAT